VCVSEIPKPTLLKIILTVMGFFSLLVGCAGMIYALQPNGHHGWAFIAVAIFLTRLLFDLPPRRPLLIARLAGGDAFLRGAFGLARKMLVAVLVCWLGLMAWAALSPGGAAPAPKTDPAMIRVLTWNILQGAEDGPHWRRCGWFTRKHALQAALHDARPDILCVQEALKAQVVFLEEILPGHGRIAVGRDDGRSAGEHCAIYFDRDRFQEIASGTFWLEDPVDEPPGPLALGPKRICTWVRLRDRRSGRLLRVYNTHLYLTERARRSAVHLILDRIALGDPSDAVLVAGDFNAPSEAPSQRLFTEAGLVSSAKLVGKQTGSATYHFYGIRLRCLDAIFVNPSWRVYGHRLLDVKPDNMYPSDHFGIMVDLRLHEG
jgi:endonuclease/exonuclease/phosphatase family metal-dependent hydrolase